MIIGLIGARGTVPTSETSTVSFIIDNKYLFECPSEFVQAFQKLQKNWAQLPVVSKNRELIALGRPTFSKIKCIILSHLHYDHWGGLAHVIHRILLLEREKRLVEPLKLIIPKNSCLPFQQRMKQMFKDFIPEKELTDDEFLYRLLAIEVGDSVRSVLQIKVIEDGETVLLEPGYSLSAKKNAHLPKGSFSYKLTFNRTKLNVKKAKELEIPFNRTLKRIEESSSVIKVGTREISRSDIFFDIKTVVGYSGDTPVDSNLFNFFSDCQLLIHEATYLTQGEGYHLDSHSDVISLVEETEKLSKLKALIPIHFSIRYTEKDISSCLNSFLGKKFSVIDPTKINLIQIKPDNSILQLNFKN